MCFVKGLTSWHTLPPVTLLSCITGSFIIWLIWLKGQKNTWKGENHERIHLLFCYLFCSTMGVVWHRASKSWCDTAGHAHLFYFVCGDVLFYSEDLAVSEEGAKWMTMKIALFTVFTCAFIGLLLVSNPFGADAMRLVYFHLPFSWAHWFRDSLVWPNEKGCQIDGSLFLILFMQINNQCLISVTECMN